MPAVKIKMMTSLRILSYNLKGYKRFEFYSKAKEKVLIEEDKNYLGVLEKDWYKIGGETIKEHFSQWIKPPILPAMIAVDLPITGKIANWIYPNKGKNT